MATAMTAVGTGGLSDRCGFAGETVEDWRSTCGRGGDRRGQSPEEFGVSLWRCDGCFHILVFLLDDFESTREWASW